LPLGLTGHHNRRNAALVAQVLRSFGLQESAVLHALATFRGAARRLEEVGTAQNGALVVSDYAHHPVEVAATLQAARERWPQRRLMVVFQPHQAQRFHAYRELFAPSLDLADALLLLEIYRARDPEELQASVAELVPELQNRPRGLAGAENEERPLSTVQDHAEGFKILASWWRPDDVVLCLGAGDVDAFARKLL
jgi:UDP-N-acetylmuramate--alanine ligase